MITRFVVPAALCVASTLHAQRPSGHSVLSGTVRDAATGGAARRTSVCAVLPGHGVVWHDCAPVDTTSAEFRLDTLPRGHWRISVICATTGMFGHLVASDSVAVSEAAPVRRDWRVSSTGCDPRPMRRIQGTFRGYFSAGFESSEFLPCAADAWFVPGDSLAATPYDERRAWAEFEKGSIPAGFVWPEVPGDQYGDPRSYVQWRGTIEGPAHYGHMGMSPFEIRIDSVLTARPPRPGDCQPLR